MLDSLIENLGHLTEIHSGTYFSPSQLRKKITRKANALKLEDSEKFILEATNSADFLITLLALWQKQAFAIIIPDNSPKIEVLAIAHQLGGAWHIRSNQKSYISSSNKKSWWYNYGHHANQLPPEKRFALMMYTSGTAQSPKGVLFSFAKIAQKLKNLNSCINDPSAFHHSLCMLPLFFNHGLVSNSLFPLLSGKHLFLDYPFSTVSIIKAPNVIESKKITFFSSVPSFWRLYFRLVSQNKMLQSLKRIHCGSEFGSFDLYQSIQSIAPNAVVVNTYGLTEANSWISGQNFSSEFTVGDVGTGWETLFKLADDGEVGIRTNALFDGYFDESGIKKPQTENNFFYTGDTGSLDLNGKLKLMGRKKNILITAGQSIHIESIEQALTRNKKIKEVAVIAMKHDLVGEVPLCFYSTDSSDNISEEIKNWSHQNLNPKHIPKKFIQVLQIPKTERGKLDRKKLLKNYEHERPL